MNGAALSVLLNISEGFLRRHDKETLQFLRYAFASNGEVKASYYAARGRQYVTDEELADLIALNESISTKDPGRTRNQALRPKDHQH